jgi:hypothetical protein
MNETEKHDNCLKEKDWGKLEEKLERYDNHLQESECRGGYRDEFANLKQHVKQLQSFGWACMLCSFIGGLIGDAVPIFGLIVKGILNHVGIKL